MPLYHRFLPSVLCLPFIGGGIALLYVGLLNIQETIHQTQGTILSKSCYEASNGPKCNFKYTYNITSNTNRINSNDLQLQIPCYGTATKQNIYEVSDKVTIYYVNCDTSYLDKEKTGKPNGIFQIILGSFLVSIFMVGMFYAYSSHRRIQIRV